MGGAGLATTPTVPHIFCPGDYILHYSCVPYTVGLITLLGNVTSENRVAKILAVILLLNVFSHKSILKFFSSLSLYCTNFEE
jgi:hypothetical protein